MAWSWTPTITAPHAPWFRATGFGVWGPQESKGVDLKQHVEDAWSASFLNWGLGNTAALAALIPRIRTLNL